MGMAYSNVTTHDGHKLTVKQIKFIDTYISTGDVGKAVKEAGYSGNVNPAKNPIIASEIEYRLQQNSKNTIADRSELMEFWTSMMRGEVLDQFDLPTTNTDKLKAASELAKRSIDIEDRVKEKANENSSPEIKVSLSWGKEECKEEDNKEESEEE